MWHRILLSLMMVFILKLSNAQVNIYDPTANAVADLENAIRQANEQGKHVLIQIGGNWCPWCIKLHNFMRSDSTISEILNQNYIWIKVNYSKENKNIEVLKRLENPQRFGFPVLVVLNSDGKRIHTQDSELLESGQGYDQNKVIGFLKNWTPKALKQMSYN